MFTPLAIPDKPVNSGPGSNNPGSNNPGSNNLGPSSSGPSNSRNAASLASKAASPTIALLRERIVRIERIYARGSSDQSQRSIPFGIESIDGVLPTGGIRLGALHEATSAGSDTEHAAAATLFIAGILARLDGPILWVLRQADLFAPGLAGAGMHPDRVVFAEAGKQVLPVMEEGFRHSGLAAVVAEHTGRLSLVASRRLQLAAEQSGILAILIRRSPSFDDPVLNEPTAAVTRWRIAALPSPPALPHAPDTPGLGRARWRLDLMRCRGGEPGSWMVEACDATGRLGLVSDAADRSVKAA
jgi:protein ImuA